MKIKISITKIRLFLLLGAILILIGVFATYAYNTNFDKTITQPPISGQSSDEVNVLLATAADGTKDIRTLQITFNDLPGKTLCELTSLELRNVGCPVGTYLARMNSFVAAGDGNYRDAYCKAFFSTNDNSADGAANHILSCYGKKYRTAGSTHDGSITCVPGSGAACDRSVCECIPSVDGAWFCNSGFWVKVRAQCW
jgi:hypothetical protein